jgi:hypothetical protein
MPVALPSLGRNARLVLATALVGFVAIWVTYRHAFAHDRLRPLAWRDLTAQVAPLEFPHGTTRFLPGPKTFALYLREHGYRGGRAPRVNFERHDLVLVALGPRSTDAHRLEIVSIVEQRSRVFVTLRERTPKLGDRVRVRRTYPFRLFTIPRTGKPKFVHIEGRP